MKANAAAGAQGQERFETVQAYYSLAGRELERELVPMMEEERIGCLVWSPLAGGYLSGKYSEGGEGSAEGRRKSFDFPPVDRARGEPIIAAMRPIAKAHDTSVARVALAWVLAKPFVTSVIIGARTIEQLDDNLEATKLKLGADEIARLDDLSAIAEDYPHWMISRFKSQRLPQDK
jgi:aryl-alcohol dehydrogenase-like predicted oxidoreductase